MRYEWDEAKRQANIDKHGVDFAAVEDFDWSSALVRADVRFAYDEVRLVALAPLGELLHSLVFTIRRTRVRLISLRRASAKEARHYAEEVPDADP